jgi:hypothetical protein
MQLLQKPAYLSAPASVPAVSHQFLNDQLLSVKCQSPKDWPFFFHILTSLNFFDG